MVSPNSSTRAGGLASAATGIRPTRSGAIQLIAARSRRTKVATSGRCTLTTTASPSAQSRRVDLGDRRGGDGRALELAELLFEGPAQVGFDDAADHGEGLGRHLVATQPELGHELLGEEPLARGEDLSQLDVGGPEALEGPAQTTRQPGP